MQPVTGAPRDGLTAAQVTALLTGSQLSVDFGADVLDASLNVTADLTPDLQSCTVSRDMTAAVHGSVQMTVTRQLAWGKDRVRPYLLLSSSLLPGVVARFNLGVYLLTTPDTPLAESPVTYQVSGFDQLHILQGYVGDSYHVDAAANVLDAVRSALSSAGVAAPVLLDSSASAAVYPAGGKTWPVTGGASNDPTVGAAGATWMTVVNDLLAAVGYQSVWCDWDGNFRSGPYVDPSLRSAEWAFTVGDLVAGVVEEDRTVSADVWGVPNKWVFFQNGASAPVEGTSQYTVNNSSSGLSSQTSLGRTVCAQPKGLDAVDYAALKTQGDKIVADALRVTETITAKLSPFPLAWHMDVATWNDPALGSARTVYGHSWSLPCDGSAMSYVWQTVEVPS